MSNIVLIGMPGCGKSRVGVLLAKALGYLFDDVDLLISRRAGKPLQKILDEDGLEYFLRLEEELGSTLDADRTVIATGGSMVLSEKAMAHLKSMGEVVFIDVPFAEIDSVEYHESFAVGTRTYGVASSRLLLGSFQSEELGAYTLYAYSPCKSAIVIRDGDHVLAVGCKTAEETKALYEQLKEAVS